MTITFKDIRDIKGNWERCDAILARFKPLNVSERLGAFKALDFGLIKDGLMRVDFASELFDKLPAEDRLDAFKVFDFDGLKDEQHRVSCALELFNKLPVEDRLEAFMGFDFDGLKDGYNRRWLVQEIFGKHSNINMICLDSIKHIDLGQYDDEAQVFLVYGAMYADDWMNSKNVALQLSNEDILIFSPRGRMNRDYKTAYRFNVASGQIAMIGGSCASKWYYSKNANARALVKRYAGRHDQDRPHQCAKIAQLFENAFEHLGLKMPDALQAEIDILMPKPHKRRYHAAKIG